MNLKRWNPFKFRRKKTTEKTAPGVALTAPPASQTRLAPTHLAPMAPFHNLFHSYWRDPFSALATGPITSFGELEQWFGDFAPRRFAPAIDVVDEKDAVKITAELPGLNREDVELSIEGDQLILRGHKRHQSEQDEDGAFRIERFYGYFERMVPLPSEVDKDQAKASFDNGVLSVRLPKKASKGETSTAIPIL